MEKFILWCMLLIILGFSFPLNTVSQNTNGNYLYQTSSGTFSGTSSGGPVAVERVIYIIVDGAGAGTALFTTADEPTLILEVNNPLTKANGHIGGIGEGEGMNCPGPLGHFHGTLRNSKDPAEDMCGWGHVAPAEQVSAGVRAIANGIIYESLIISLIEKDPPAYEIAARTADQSAQDLSTLQDDVRDPNKTMIGKGKAHQISDKLGKAINADKFIVMTLNPLPEKRDGEKDIAITLKINNALMAKQDALMILIEAEATAAAMAAMAMGE